MSVTVTAVPVAFISAKVIAALAGTFGTIAAANGLCALKSAVKNSELDDLLYNIESASNNENLKNKLYKLNKEQIDLLTQDYETPFMDNELLVRTLEEYGLNVVENSEKFVIAKIERIILTFARKDKENPYTLRIAFPQDCEEMQADVATNIFEEYGCNTQEETYIKLKEKIDASNMYIEDEEVLEDDSIVLTISLD